MAGKTLILGLGNILMGDEGVGVKSIDYLRDRLDSPLLEEKDVELLDGGTGGFHLLSLFREYEKFIIIDATLGDGELGKVAILKPRFAADFPRSLTSHDIGLRDLMQSAELLGELPEIFLVTINISEFNNVHIGLSEAIENSLPKVEQAVLEIVKKLN